MARKLKQDNLYFETIDTEYKSYILGFIFADGSIYDGRTKDRPNRQLRLSIYCASSDDYIFEQFQYGVWIVNNDVPVEVIEASNDFDYLKKKYNVKYLIIIGSYEE